MIHWLDVELWGPMWPNMFAPSAITLANAEGLYGHAEAVRARGIDG